MTSVAEHLPRRSHISVDNHVWTSSNMHGVPSNTSNTLNTMKLSAVNWLFLCENKQTVMLTRPTQFSTHAYLMRVATLAKHTRSSIDLDPPCVWNDHKALMLSCSSVCFCHRITYIWSSHAFIKCLSRRKVKHFRKLLLQCFQIYLYIILICLWFCVLQAAHVIGQEDGGHGGCVPGFQVKHYQVPYNGAFQKGQVLLQGQWKWSEQTHCLYIVTAETLYLCVLIYFRIIINQCYWSPMQSSGIYTYRTYAHIRYTHKHQSKHKATQLL